MTTGMTAGVFATWSSAIMPGLSSVDDRTFVAAYRALDAAMIADPLFIGVGFTGALLSIGLSAGLHLGAEHRRVVIWVGAALVCYLLVAGVTFGVHEPLNQTIRTGAELDSDGDYAAARDRLDEAKWATWNALRAVASTIAFGCLAWALVIQRRPGQGLGR